MKFEKIEWFFPIFSYLLICLLLQEVSFLRTMDNVSLNGDNKQRSKAVPLSTSLSGEKEENYSPSFKMFAVPRPDLDCTFVKSETVSDVWTDQSSKIITKVNPSGNPCKELTECNELPNELIETDSYHNVKLPILSPVSKPNKATTTFEDDHALQEVKKEKDSLDHFNVNFSFNPQQKKTVMGKLKHENIPDLYNEFECGNIINHSDEIKSIGESLCDGGLINTETKRTPLNVLAKKTKPLVNFKTNCKRKLRPILPKINSLVVGSLSVFGHMKKQVVDSNIQTILRNKKLERCKKQGVDFENKRSIQDGSLHKECSKKFGLIKNIKEEAIRDKLSADYSCRLCKTECEDEITLKNHVKEHSKNGMSYSCCFCKKSFKSRSGLYNHTTTNHTKKFRFCCEICGQGYANQSRLEEHRSSHTKEQLHVCDVCGKKFSSRGTYWIHRKWHFDPLPYRCSDCGQLFKHSSLLSLHKKRKHTGERPFKCPYCILTFNVSGTFKRHLILHTKNYPYKCVMCKQGFTTRFKYADHMLKEHSVVIDKPKFKKKDYKVVVHDEAEDLDLLRNTSVSDSLVKDLSGKSLTCIPDNANNNIVEIVLTPSNNLTEHIITLPGNWLT